MDIIANFGINFYHSSFFSAVKFFLGIYSIVLLADIVLVLVAQVKNKDLISDIRTTFMGTALPISAKNKLLKRWEEIQRRLELGNISQYKVAVLEADSIANEILGVAGYKGENLGEKLEAATHGQLSKPDELREAHDIRNRIIHERDFHVDRQLAESTVKIYENLLKELEFI